jgi:hypothetical protein
MTVVDTYQAALLRFASSRQASTFLVHIFEGLEGITRTHFVAVSSAGMHQTALCSGTAQSDAVVFGIFEMKINAIDSYGLLAH